MTTIESASFEESVERVRGDLVAHRLAADLRIGRVPREQVAHEDGTPRWEFVGRADTAYAAAGGEVSDRFIGTVARAVIALAYDTPATRYEVRTDEEGLSPLYVIDAVTRTELGLRLIDIVCQAQDRIRPQVRLEITARTAVAKDENGRRLAAFAITVQEAAA